MGRRRIAFALTIATAALPSGPAAAVVFELTPSATVGATDNPLGLTTGATDNNGVVLRPQWDLFVMAAAGAHLRYTHARARHRFGYQARLTRYATTTGADNFAQAVDWLSEVTPNGRTTLSFGATASLFRYSALLGGDPMTANTNSVATGAVSTEVLTANAFQNLIYEPNGRSRYLETLNVGYLRPVSGAVSTVRESVLGSVNLRGERPAGRNAYFLNLYASDYALVGAPPAGAANDPGSLYASGDVLSGTLMAGGRREMSARTSVEIEAGALAFYGVANRALAVGPAALGTLTYHRIPWYAILTVGQQPIVNVYVGDASIGDSATLRLALPLDLREAFIISGYAGYTYARRIAPGEHFLFAPRAYDLITLGGSVLYRFQKLPILAGLAYSVMDQRGSVIEVGNTTVVGAPSYLRRVLGLTIEGTFAWGEGNYGLPPPI